MSSKIKVDTIEDVAGTSNISIGTNLTMDVAGDITLDAGGADVKLSDDGTNFLTFTKSSNDVTINTPISDGDISFVGNDGGSAITSMKMDMSAGGAVTIDPSNNLSTASGANAKLNVGSLSGTAGALNVNVAGTNGAGAYRLINATDGVTTNFLVKTDNSGSENRLELGPETASAICFEIQGAERMKINPAGLVTKPNTPAFRVHRTAGNYTSTTVIVWNVVTYNQGGHYNSSNGRFTAPVTGVYQFNVMGSITGSPVNSSLHRASINGSYQIDVFPIGDDGAAHISYANSFLLNLSANDYVEISSASGGNWYGTGNVHNHYSGFLVG
tara:strand:+ start:1585 stop:2568 length:984 start_codon:yes stop_codon:yes gene_type:complete